MSGCVPEVQGYPTNPTLTEAITECTRRFCNAAAACCDENGFPEGNIILVPGTMTNPTTAPMILIPGGDVCMPGDTHGFC